MKRLNKTNVATCGQWLLNHLLIVLTLLCAHALNTLVTLPLILCNHQYSGEHYFPIVLHVLTTRNYDQLNTTTLSILLDDCKTILGWAWVQTLHGETCCQWTASLRLVQTQLKPTVYSSFNLTLLSTNSISLPAHGNLFLHHFSFPMLPVFLFVIKLTLPFLQNSILTARIHVKRARDSECGISMTMCWSLFAFTKSFHVILNYRNDHHTYMHTYTHKSP